MPRHSYREHDYAFGQAMLTLRKRLHLTQAGLAAHLGVSRRAVGEWEAGSTYPKEEHLQHLIALCVRQHVFAPEQEKRRSAPCGTRPINGCCRMKPGSRPSWPGPLPRRPLLDRPAPLR